jgi:hypothetical protein
MQSAFVGYPFILSPDYAALHTRLAIIVDEKGESLRDADRRLNVERSAGLRNIADATVDRAAIS